MSSTPQHSISKPQRVVGYYPSWACYRERQFDAFEIPVDNLTHLVYAFAKIQKDGQCDHHDKFADVDKVFQTTDASDASDASDATNNVAGNVWQIWCLKKRNRHLKTMVSIGGWRLSENWSEACSTPTRRQKFVETCMHCMYNFGWDGIDLAWMYPSSEADQSNYVELIRLFREALGHYEQKTGNPHRLLSVTVPGKIHLLKHIDMMTMTPYVDFFNVMAYDNTAESPDNYRHHLSRHMANLKPSPDADRSGAFNISESLSHLTQVKGVNASDINLGISLYGRGYYGCDHPGASYSTLDGDWQRTLWDAKDLPPVGSSERWDEDAQAAWSFDPEQRLVVSYENGRSIAAKSSYIRNEAKLGGVCFWDVTADKSGANSLIRQAARALGGNDLAGLDRSSNSVYHPWTDRANINASGLGSSSDGGATLSNSKGALSGEISMRLSADVMKQLFPFLPEKEATKVTFFLG